jgi:adenylate kinase family enzyme
MKLSKTYRMSIGGIMNYRIHILGASGCGVTTLGRLLGNALSIPVFDNDDFYWHATEIAYTKKREIPELIDLMQQLFLPRSAWVLSGSLDSYADKIMHRFTHVIFLECETEERMKRLTRRETLRGTINGKESQDFLDWAKHYDDGTREGRSKPRHEKWLEGLECPVIRLNSQLSQEELVRTVLAKL